MALPRLADLIRQPARVALAAALAIVLSATVVAPARCSRPTMPTWRPPRGCRWHVRPATRPDRAPGVTRRAV